MPCEHDLRHGSALYRGKNNTDVTDRSTITTRILLLQGLLAHTRRTGRLLLSTYNAIM